MRFAAVLAITMCIAGPAIAARTPPAHPHAANEIDGLFSALGKAQSEEEARPIENKILAAFLRSGSPMVDLLMNRAASAMKADDSGAASALIAAVTGVAPNYAEGWRQRAILLDAVGDDRGAMFCLQKAISLNPRQFEALAELASKVEEYGDKPGALKLYRKALALDPHFDDLTRKVRALSHDVEGESL